MTVTPPLLEIDDLSVSYRSRSRRTSATTALNGVSLTVEVGETVALVGESGSDKSTLGNAVLGLVPATQGRILFEGRDITHLKGAQRRSLSQSIQAVFQDPYSSFNPNRTVGQTVAETLPGGDARSAAGRRRVREMLERVGLDGSAADRFPAQFSGGQRQRIAIARALLPSPRLVVCDESVSALDLSVQAQVLNLLADLQADLGVAYVFITHDMSVVRHVSRRVVVLRRGDLIEQGRTLDVLERPTAAYTRNLVAAAPVADPALQTIRREARRAAASITAAHGRHAAVMGASSLCGQVERRAVVDSARLADPVQVGALDGALSALVGRDGVDAYRAARTHFHLTVLDGPSSAAAPAPEVREFVAAVWAHEPVPAADNDLAQTHSAYTALRSAIAAGNGERALAAFELILLSADRRSQDAAAMTDDLSTDSTNSRTSAEG